MESRDRNSENPGSRPHDYSDNKQNGRTWGGVFVVLVGGLLLARQAGADIPHWLFSFESLLVAFGIYLGIRHGFRGFIWLIPLAIGGFLLMGNVFPWHDVHRFTWPLLIIGFGLFLILRSLKKSNTDKSGRPPFRIEDESTDDLLDSVVIFGGVKRSIITKDFRGGEAVTVFGGTELNFMQAGLIGPVELELTQIFGGTKLIVPANWKIQSKEIVAVLGGVDDKRPVVAPAGDSAEQILILKGTSVFGGIEIRSY